MKVLERLGIWVSVVAASEICSDESQEKCLSHEGDGSLLQKMQRKGVHPTTTGDDVPWAKNTNAYKITKFNSAANDKGKIVLSKSANVCSGDSRQGGASNANECSLDDKNSFLGSVTYTITEDISAKQDLLSQQQVPGLLLTDSFSLDVWVKYDIEFRNVSSEDIVRFGSREEQFKAVLGKFRVNWYTSKLDDVDKGKDGDPFLQATDVGDAPIRCFQTGVSKYAIDEHKKTIGQSLRMNVVKSKMNGGEGFGFDVNEYEANKLSQSKPALHFWFRNCFVTQASEMSASLFQVQIYQQNMHISNNEAQVTGGFDSIPGNWHIADITVPAAPWVRPNMNPEDMPPAHYPPEFVKKGYRLGVWFDTVENSNVDTANCAANEWSNVGTCGAHCDEGLEQGTKQKCKVMITPKQQARQARDFGKEAAISHLSPSWCSQYDYSVPGFSDSFEFIGADWATDVSGDLGPPPTDFDKTITSAPFGAQGVPGGIMVIRKWCKLIPGSTKVNPDACQDAKKFDSACDLEGKAMSWIPVLFLEYDINPTLCQTERSTNMRYVIRYSGFTVTSGSDLTPSESRESRTISQLFPFSTRVKCQKAKAPAPTAKPKTPTAGPGPTAKPSGSSRVFPAMSAAILYSVLVFFM